MASFASCDPSLGPPIPRTCLPTRLQIAATALSTHDRIITRRKQKERGLNPTRIERMTFRKLAAGI